jgi:hypothetical protein
MALSTAEESGARMDMPEHPRRLLSGGRNRYFPQTISFLI